MNVIDFINFQLINLKQFTRRGLNTILNVMDFINFQLINLKQFTRMGLVRNAAKCYKFNKMLQIQQNVTNSTIMLFFKEFISVGLSKNVVNVINSTKCLKCNKMLYI